MLIAMILSVSTACAVQNAADFYLKLQPEYDEQNQQLESKVLWIQACLEHGYPITDDMRSTLQSATAQTIKLIYEATSSEHCDFELPLEEEGFYVLLPHLSHVLYGTHALGGEAGLAMQFGDHENFSKAIVAGLAMADDANSDPCVVSSMVSLAMAKQIDAWIDDAMERDFIRPIEAKHIAAALSQSIDGDAFGLNKAVSNERAMCNTWLPNRLGLSETDTLDETALDELFGMFDSVSIRGVDQLAPKNLTASEVRLALQKLDASFGELAAAVRNPNRKAGMRAAKQISKELKEGKGGFLSRLLLPSLDAALQKRNEAIERFQKRIGELNAITSEDGLDPKLANAAWWWIRAGEVASTLGPTWIDDPQLTGEIDVILAEASALPNAQYPQPWEGYLEATVPWWLPNQDLLLWGLLERANRSIAKKDTTAAVRDLVLCIRMTAALSLDPRIVTSLVAAGAVDSLAAILPAAASAGLLDQESKASLEQLLRTIPVRDPVGLQRAFRGTHDRLVEQGPNGPDEAKFELPAAGPSLLNAVAYLRGWSAAQGPQSPLFYVVPGGSAAHLRLCRLDTNLLDAWYELGTQSDQLAGFAELGGIDAEATTNAVPGMIQQARDALRR